MSISLRKISKWLGPNLVVNDVSLEIQDGELFVLLGASGSGKSTVLRLIAGLLLPDSGQIILGGRDVTFLPPQARHTGFVFQNYSVFRHMTVAENVAFGLRIRGVAADERQRRSDTLLELVGLAGLGARYAHQLSGGQQQRVALARALAYEPAVLLLDEPFGALDVRIRAQVRLSLKEVQQRLRVTTILVTHDQEEAFALADRIAVFDQGQVTEVGPPEALYYRPRAEHTATFIGGANVLAGRLLGGQIQLGQVRLPLPPEAPAHEEGSPVRVLFRPETVQIQETPFRPDQAVHSLGQADVREVVFTGALDRLVLAVPDLTGARPIAPRPHFGQTMVRIEALRPGAGWRATAPAPDQSVWVALSGYHVLDPAGLQFLIYLEESARDMAVGLGLNLARLAGGRATVLAVADAPARRGAAQAALNRVQQAWQARLPTLSTRIRTGGLAEELRREAYEGLYDLVVLPRALQGDLGASVPWSGGRSGDRIMELWPELLNAGFPVLLASSAGGPAGDSTPRRILICTAAGEPGKSDIYFGGRLARHAGAEVTLLHVLRPGAGAAERDRAERHLSQGRASLAALEVPVQTRLDSGRAFVDQLATLATSEAFDLLVIGAPAPRQPERLTWPDLAREVVARVGQAVLIVPMDG